VNEDARAYCLSRAWKHHITVDVEKLQTALPSFRANNILDKHVATVRKSFLESGVANELGSSMVAVVFLSKFIIKLIVYQ